MWLSSAKSFQEQTLGRQLVALLGTQELETTFFSQC
jgi:hypothetical protein